MVRTLYDSTAAADIPTSAAMVAGYLAPSKFAWSTVDWDRFPHAVKVRIAVRATTNDGHVLDVERGDATPAQALGWVTMRRAAGADPTVYCSESLWPSVKAAFTAAAVAQPHYWVAAYPGGGRVIPVGAIAHQYADPATSGGHFDLSVVADHWPGVDQEAPVTTPIDKMTSAQVDLLNGTIARFAPGNTANNNPAGDMATAIFAIAGRVDSDTAPLATKADVQAVAAAVTNLAAAVADLKAAQTPATVLTGEATVTVNLTPGATA